MFELFESETLMQKTIIFQFAENFLQEGRDYDVLQRNQQIRIREKV